VSFQIVFHLVENIRKYSHRFAFINEEEKENIKAKHSFTENRDKFVVHLPQFVFIYALYQE
jgi:hypothetical protein